MWLHLSLCLSWCQRTRSCCKARDKKIQRSSRIQQNWKFCSIPASFWPLKSVQVEKCFSAFSPSDQKSLVGREWNQIETSIDADIFFVLWEPLGSWSGAGPLCEAVRLILLAFVELQSWARNALLSALLFNLCECLHTGAPLFGKYVCLQGWLLCARTGQFTHPVSPAAREKVLQLLPHPPLPCILLSQTAHLLKGKAFSSLVVAATNSLLSVQQVHKGALQSRVSWQSGPAWNQGCSLSPPGSW